MESLADPSVPGGPTLKLGPNLVSRIGLTISSMLWVLELALGSRPGTSVLGAAWAPFLGIWGGHWGKST